MPDTHGWLDLSVPLHSGMAHWPDDPEPNFQKISEIEQGAEATVTLCRMTAHTGTHMDAPCHFLQGEAGIDRFPIETGIGPAQVITMPDERRVISAAELQGENIPRGGRVLLKTKNSSRRWDDLEFQPDYAGIDSSAAGVLVNAGVVLVGVDYLSVGVYQGDIVETHKILLKAGIWIVEGLDLSALSDDTYDLICLPLRIAGCDGAPARVVARRRAA